MKSNVLPCDNDQRLCVILNVLQQNFDASCWNWFLNWIHVRGVNIGSRSILLLNTEFYQQEIQMSSTYFSGNLLIQMRKTEKKEEEQGKKKHISGTYSSFKKIQMYQKQVLATNIFHIPRRKKKKSSLIHRHHSPYKNTKHYHCKLIYRYLNPRVNGLQYQG